MQITVHDVVLRAQTSLGRLPLRKALAQISLIRLQLSVVRSLARPPVTASDQRNVTQSERNVLILYY